MSVLVTDLLDGLSLEEKQDEVLGLLDQILDRLGILTAVREANGALRVSSVGGTVAISSLPTLATVTNVGTVGNQTNLGGFSAAPLSAAQQNMAAQSNINQIVVS